MSNRCRIKGILTSTTPFHIGSGDTTKREELVKKESKSSKQNKEYIEISAVATDVSERAYLPGTVIKGNLRSWLVRNNAAPELIETIFGSENMDSKNAVGGKVEFCDAFCCGISETSKNVSYWNPERLTGVSVSIAIDPVTRTAAPEKLFHEEFVPPGTSFALEVTGQGLTQEEKELLLFAFEEGFRESDQPVTLGAGTADRYGRFEWKLTEIAELTDKDIQEWLNLDKPPVGYKGLKPVDNNTFMSLKSKVIKNFSSEPQASLKLTLILKFAGPFLVNDPSNIKKKDNEGDSDDKPADHLPLRNSKGQIVLPARSIRGALRSQAKKLIRTINCNAVCPEKTNCKAINSMQELEKLCIGCYLFGAPGWRSPVEFSDFIPLPGQEGKPFHQESVAIDRFTGGSAYNQLSKDKVKGFKFNTDAVYKPALTGTMTVELSRPYFINGKMKNWEMEPWALGLLVLTLRDLLEGDIPLGFGAARGYGACSVDVEKVEIRGLSLSKQYSSLLEQNNVTDIDINKMNLGISLPIEIRNILKNISEAFIKKCQIFHASIFNSTDGL